MDKKEILQFEADDTSEMGINGKQVFFTKRINGKTTHNKIDPENVQQANTLNQNPVIENNNEELYIEIKNPHYQQTDESKKKNKTTKQNNKNKAKKASKKKKTKAQKQREKRKRVLKIFLLIIVIIGVAVFALISPVFNIDKIEVNGNEKITSDTIISLSGVQEGSNIFKTVKKDIIKKIKENTYIDSVSVKRVLPGTIKIDVKERKIAYQIKAINSYVYIDYQGYILEVSSKSSNVPFIEGLSTNQDTLLNGKRIENNDLKLLNTILKIMEATKNADISKSISKITIQNSQYILELKNEKKTVYLGDATDITNRITFLKAILDKEKGNSGKVFLNGEFNNGFKPYFREDIKKEKKEENKEKKDSKDNKENAKTKKVIRKE